MTYYHQVHDHETGEITQVPFTAEEQAYADSVLPGIAMETLRNERKGKLAETDYWALSDYPMTDEQRAYRQALRDLPANTTDPSNPVWPTKP